MYPFEGTVLFAPYLVHVRCLLHDVRVKPLVIVFKPTKMNVSTPLSGA